MPPRWHLERVDIVPRQDGTTSGGRGGAQVPPRVQHEEIELKPIASQAQQEAGPSRLAATNHAETQSS
ncbi:hypothetical protein P692DRAFT_201786022 [Suillus brevipes Sb2]|nr:hypothetical protein P692DRAFT_201786022 [Suillus brevipes Sb2]